MYGLEIIEGNSKRIITFEKNISLEKFIDIVVDNCGQCRSDYDLSYLIKINDNNINEYERLCSNLIWSHGHEDDGIIKIDQKYIKEIAEKKHPKHIIDILKNNIGKYIAYYDVYPRADIEEMESIIFDNIIDVCKHYMRTSQYLDCEYKQIK